MGCIFQPDTYGEEIRAQGADANSAAATQARKGEVMDRLTSLNDDHDAFSGATQRKRRPDMVQTRDDELTIGQMSRLYGVSLRTLRFYEDRGLMAPRREGGARYYRRGERARMEMILRGKKLGFTLSEITDLIGGQGASDAPDLEDRLEAQQIVSQIVHLERQRDEIETAIARLKATTLRRAAAA
jgi:DNA-binding transcriptional MerR regulator